MIIENLKAQKKNLRLPDDGEDEMGEAKSPTIMETAMKNDHWERHIEELILNHARISKIQGLENFHNLRKLKLLDNCITEIEGLDRLKVLEELSLEKNKLTVI